GRSLNERYASEINTYLTSHITAFRMCFESGGTVGVQSFLNDQAEVESAAFHRNHWRPVLLGALALHLEFCDGGFLNVL
ncbi:MAG TPA: HNH endonuclease, partial [Xanthobacteraceae bacterium]|nr:HNH endonuclease [Xanthobacteraceae bacterium]